MINRYELQLPMLQRRHHKRASNPKFIRTASLSIVRYLSSIALDQGGTQLKIFVGTKRV